MSSLNQRFNEKLHGQILIIVEITAALFVALSLSQSFSGLLVCTCIHISIFPECVYGAHSNSAQRSVKLTHG